MQFRDRKHAGKVLAGKLEHFRDHPDVIVLALPRGGVPVAFEVAKALNAPLADSLRRAIRVCILQVISAFPEWNHAVVRCTLHPL